MGFFEVFMVGVGLSMDAFAAAICKGLSMRRATLKNVLTIGLFFGGFQALMPAIGYFLGKQFEEETGIKVDYQIVGPVIAAHCGPGTLGLIFYGNK